MNTQQLRHIQNVVRRVKERGLPERAAHIAIAVVLVESNAQMYANGNNPRSLQLPHDAVGWDHGSVGLFQQQVGGAYNSTANWGTTDELMNVRISTDRFCDALIQKVKAAGGWGPQFTNGVMAQRVQVSAFPDEYAKRDAEAIQLVRKYWNTPVPAPAPKPVVRRYTVRSGDNLTSIARKFGTTWQALKKVNNIPNADMIYPGQVLIIPN